MLLPRGAKPRQGRIKLRLASSSEHQKGIGAHILGCLGPKSCPTAGIQMHVSLQIQFEAVAVVKGWMTHFFLMFHLLVWKLMIVGTVILEGHKISVYISHNEYEVMWSSKPCNGIPSTPPFQTIEEALGVAGQTHRRSLSPRH